MRKIRLVILILTNHKWTSYIFSFCVEWLNWQHMLSADRRVWTARKCLLRRHLPLHDLHRPLLLPHCQQVHHQEHLLCHHGHEHPHSNPHYGHGLIMIFCQDQPWHQLSQRPPSHLWHGWEYFFTSYDQICDKNTIKDEGRTAINCNTLPSLLIVFIVCFAYTA